jgi:AcrR family transcriptional regulator
MSEPVSRPIRSVREALLNAALAYIERDGPAGISLREVARSAGVSHNAPYRHFPTREALLAEAARMGFEELKSHLHAASALDCGDRLVALGTAYFKFAQKHPGLFRLMFAGGLDQAAYPGLSIAAAETFRLLTEATGVEGAEAREAALGAWSLAHGLSHLAVEGQLGNDLSNEIRDGTILRRVVSAYDNIRRNIK